MKIKMFHILFSLLLVYAPLFGKTSAPQPSLHVYNKKTVPSLQELSLNTKPVQENDFVQQVREEQPDSALPKKFGIAVTFDQNNTPNTPPAEAQEPKSVSVTAKKDPEKEILLKKTIRDMTLEEILVAKQYAQEWGNNDLLIKYGERLIVMATDHQYQELVRTTRLQLADLYFQQGDMKKAGKLYREYVKFYPGSLQRDYAEYKTILTRFYTRLQPPRDQSKTKQTVMLAHSYLERKTGYPKAYSSQVQEMLDTCYQDLYTYEIGIFHHYFNLERFKAAQTRLENIKTDFLSTMPSVEPELLSYEITLAQKQGDTKNAETLLETLKQKFPTYTTPLLTAQVAPKKSFADRF